MKSFILALAVTVALASCNKEPLPIVTEQSQPQQTVQAFERDTFFITATQFEDVYVELEKCHLWTREQLLEVIPVGADSRVLNLTPEEKYAMLMRSLQSSNRSEDVIVTIASKPTGNANINGGKETWDCNATLLAQCISQLGQPCPAKSPINYFKTGSSATSIGISDISRAANGYYLNAEVPEVEDVVFVNQYSGPSNWQVDVTLFYNGEMYIFSDALMLEGIEVPGVHINYSLIFFPTQGMEGAYSMVGAGLPAGINELIGTGWIPPNEVQ